MTQCAPLSAPEVVVCGKVLDKRDTAAIRMRQNRNDKRPGTRARNGRPGQGQLPSPFEREAVRQCTPFASDSRNEASPAVGHTIHSERRVQT